ncbi:MAG: aspartate aminotransferase family protein [Clostridia bacterium]|nr:aspartate aminotransferase family protein [Clostridia bacterium]
MNLKQVQELDSQYYMNTFGARTPVCFTEGKGITLKDTEGKEYRDFFAGIAVNCLGYSHPRMVAELQDQVAKLTHISNVFYTENQARLAELLVKNSCCDRVFFANTGAEANEGAIKLAKKYFVEQGKPEKREFITLRNSFHGRTLATVAATGQEKYQKPYRPLLEKFIHVGVNDCDALRQAVNPNTAAIMVEWIQGESGVLPLTEEFARTIAEVCKANDTLLIADEVQTGIGRTGKLFAYEWYGVEPDIVTLAKGLGGGVPIGAFLAKEQVAAAFTPGDHGTTFGGNPLSTRAGLVVMDELLNNGVLAHAAEMGEYMKAKLENIDSDKIATVRGKGLMLGVVFNEDIAKAIGTALRESGYIVGVVGTKVLRLVPPLVVTKEDIDAFCGALAQVLK